jgi:hypothetical protein
MATAGASGTMAFSPAARIPARRTGPTPSIEPWKSTGQGSTGRIAEEQRGRWTGRRPWRRIAVPGEGTANTGQGGAHEHHWITGKQFIYLVELGVG